MKNNRSISARVTQEVVDAFEKARKTNGHKYYDRANAYIIKKSVRQGAGFPAPRLILRAC